MHLNTTQGASLDVYIVETNTAIYWNLFCCLLKYPLGLNSLLISFFTVVSVQGRCDSFVVSDTVLPSTDIFTDGIMKFEGLIIHESS